MTIDPDGIRIVPRGRARRRVWMLAAVAVTTLAAVSFSLRRNVVRPGSEAPTRKTVVLPPASATKPADASSQSETDRAGDGSQSATSPVVPSDSPRISGLRAVHTERAVPQPTEKATGAGSSEQTETQQAEALARDLIDGAKAIGENKGVAAFPRPGTDPIKAGLVVPDDFELPEGYIRHYQITDDGRRLEPILMFSPDYEFVDAAGNPVALPEDGIVPPDMAPPGLPLRKLEIPKNPYGAP